MKNSLVYVSYRDRKALALGVKAVYNSPISDEAEAHFEGFSPQVGRALLIDRQESASQLAENYPNVWLPGRNPSGGSNRPELIYIISLTPSMGDNV